VFITPFLLYRFDAAEREVLVTFISIESGITETVLCTGYLSLIKNEVTIPAINKRHNQYHWCNGDIKETPLINIIPLPRDKEEL